MIFSGALFYARRVTRILVTRECGLCTRGIVHISARDATEMQVGYTVTDTDSHFDISIATPPVQLLSKG